MDWTMDIVFPLCILLVFAALGAMLIRFDEDQALSRCERRDYARMRRRMNEHDEAAETQIDAERVAAQAWRDWHGESEVSA